MIVRRIAYTTLLTLLAIVAGDVETISVTTFAAVFIFGFSFMWQYYLVNHLLPAIRIEHRAVAAFLWMLCAIVLVTLGAYLLILLDWSQPRDVILDILATRMTIFLVAASMFVGGACGWRSFYRRGALIPREKIRP